MEHFEVKFEEQKIPEWYDFYFDYKYLKTLIASTKLKIKCKYITQSNFLFRGCRHETTRILRPKLQR